MALADMYDEEFNRNLLLAKVLIPKVERRQDREICSKWIARLCSLETPNISVKRNRNYFLKYLLTVIHKGITTAPEDHAGYPQYDDRFRPKDPAFGGKGYLSKWSADGRTYVAAKPLPGKGALIYMAVVKDILYGWDIPKTH